jgi:DNA-binding PadR family transcriptional regulator
MADEPMREPTFLILAALAGGRLHGYGLIQTVQALSGGRVVLRPGTVYGALDRLENDGLVVDDGEETEQGRVRRYYRLTERGATVSPPTPRSQRRDCAGFGQAWREPQ